MNDFRKATHVETEAGDDVKLLVDFVRNRDVPCPRCGYNLRNLVQPICPECKEALKLQVGIERIQVLWLLLTLAPGTFCAVALALIGTVMVFVGPPPGAPPPPVIFAFCFMGASALFTIGLAVRFRRFLFLTIPVQFMWALGAWVANVGAFGLFVLLNT